MMNIHVSPHIIMTLDDVVTDASCLHIVTIDNGGTTPRVHQLFYCSGDKSRVNNKHNHQDNPPTRARPHPTKSS